MYKAGPKLFNTSEAKPPEFTQRDTFFERGGGFLTLSFDSNAFLALIPGEQYW